MKVTSLTVTRKVKVSLGNYENTDFELTMTAELEGEDASLASRTLATRVSHGLQDILSDFFEAGDLAKRATTREATSKKVSRYVP